MVVKIEGIITIKIGLPFSIGDIVRKAKKQIEEYMIKIN